MPICPEFQAGTLSELAYNDAMLFADTGIAWAWLARNIKGGRDRRLFGSLSWASMANAAPMRSRAELAYQTNDRPVR
jgi:pyruvate dehydrogenase (quinone)